MPGTGSGFANGFGQMGGTRGGGSGRGDGIGFLDPAQDAQPDAAAGRIKLIDQLEAGHGAEPVHRGQVHQQIELLAGIVAQKPQNGKQARGVNPEAELAAQVFETLERAGQGGFEPGNDIRGSGGRGFAGGSRRNGRFGAHSALSGVFQSNTPFFQI